MQTQEDKSKQFAFIGFRTDLQAHEAINYFNRTFIDTCRITSELAHKVGDLEISRPWSCHPSKKKAVEQAYAALGKRLLPRPLPIKVGAKSYDF
ncbi:hypothetical protein M0R45_026485 [Rubus argutus]|uniref:RRM domain-containing protein n=1 Tax=Rubus argutus TaxID=59490 RepID=A0AAW1X092_RUBAR